MLQAENKRLNEEVANHAKQLAEIKAFLQSQNGGALFSPHASPVSTYEPSWLRQVLSVYDYSNTCNLFSFMQSQSTVGSNNPPQLQAGDRSTPSPGHARQIASPDD